MTDQVNITTKQGDFLTGQMDFYQIATIVPVAVTNVSTPVQDLPSYQTFATTSVWSNVAVVDGNGVTQTYTSEATYLDAYYKQMNLNNLVEGFALRGNPVSVTVVSIPVTSSASANLTSYFGQFCNISNVTGVFGSATTATQVNLVSLTSERTAYWNIDTTTPDGNLTGYQLLGTNGLQGRVAYDTVSSQVLVGSVAGSNEVTENTGSVGPVYKNIFDSATPASYNTLAMVKVVNPYYK